MLLPDVLIPTEEMPIGSHMYGYAHGCVILPNLQLNDSAEINRSAIINNGIITFDPAWVRPVSKSYMFLKVCPTTFNIFLPIYEADIGHMTRLWTTDWVEFGITNPDQTKFTYYRNGYVDIQLALISLLEISKRTPI